MHCDRVELIEITRKWVQLREFRSIEVKSIESYLTQTESIAVDSLQKIKFAFFISGERRASWVWIELIFNYLLKWILNESDSTEMLQ